MGIQRQRFLRGDSGPLIALPLVGGGPEKLDDQICVRKPRVSRSKVRVAGDGSLEISNRFGQELFLALVPVVASLKVEGISLRINRPLLCKPLLLLGRQTDADLTGDLARELSLQ